MKQSESIHLLDVLRLLDESSMPGGEPIYHQIAFIKFSASNPKDNGQICRLNKVVKCGLRFNQKELMRRGLKDVYGNIRNCHIRLIIEFDNKKVVW